MWESKVNEPFLNSWRVCVLYYLCRKLIISGPETARVERSSSITAFKLMCVGLGCVSKCSNFPGCELGCTYYVQIGGGEPATIVWNYFTCAIINTFYMVDVVTTCEANLEPTWRDEMVLIEHYL